MASHSTIVKVKKELVRFSTIKVRYNINMIQSFRTFIVCYRLYFVVLIIQHYIFIQDPEELMKRKFHAKCLFRALGRLVMANAYWLIEAADHYEGLDNVKRRVEQAVRSKLKKKQLLNIDVRILEIFCVFIKYDNLDSLL